MKYPNYQHNKQLLARQDGASNTVAAAKIFQPA